MQLTEETKSRLASEFQYVGERMRELEGEPFEQLYFFTAVFGEISRALNRSWDRELALVHQVTQDAHRQVASRAQLRQAGPPDQRVVRLPRELMAALTAATLSLAQVFQAGEN